MKGLRLKLDISISYTPREQRDKLIKPLEKVLGKSGVILFSFPGFTLIEKGETLFDDVSLDIILIDLPSINLLKSGLSQLGLLEKANLSFRDNESNLLEFI